MAIPKYVKDRFDTIITAAKAGDLACLECKDAKSGEDRYVLTAVNRNADGSVEMIPFGAVNSSDNPFDDYLPPD